MLGWQTRHGPLVASQGFLTTCLGSRGSVFPYGSSFMKITEHSISPGCPTQTFDIMNHLKTDRSRCTLFLCATRQTATTFCVVLDAAARYTVTLDGTLAGVLSTAACLIRALSYATLCTSRSHRMCKRLIMLRISIHSGDTGQELGPSSVINYEHFLMPERSRDTNTGRPTAWTYPTNMRGLHLAYLQARMRMSAATQWGVVGRSPHM